ncbi:pentatricopeptide repeat-containing protein At3g14330-like, partial [Morus notabilis]|uniref:pentatricopeptide repeat-containing protein At3g14330-like n=1 Tax=Morus notabilis TaxID=981085 RepID=UPI000CED5801
MIPAISLSNITVPTNLTVTSGPNISKTHTTTTYPTPTPNSTLKSLAKSGKLEDALRLIESWPSKFPAAPEPDAGAYSLLLHACISRRSLEHGQRLYLQLLLARDRGKHNLVKNPTLKSKLITLYSVCGRLDEACGVFLDGLEDGEEVPESVWVAMAIGYSRNGLPKQALLLYCEMLARFVRPGNFAFSTALKACFDMFDLRVGRAVHGQIVKSSEEPDQVVSNALLRLYAECGCTGGALKVFETMRKRNIVSWNSLIASFSGRDQVFDALDAFRKMQGEGMGFSWVTVTTILSVCTRVTALRSGKEIHVQIVKSANRPDIPLLNSLLDMYAKCGQIDYCGRLFNEMQGKDLTSWNTMLTGYAVNGFIEEAMELFDEMVESGIKPDEVTFVVLLSGCSHAGLIDEGQRLFNEMKSEFGVSPTIEHYACLVDI